MKGTGGHRGKVGLHVGDRRDATPDPPPAASQALLGPSAHQPRGRGTVASRERIQQGRFPRTILNPVQKRCHFPKTSAPLPSAEPTLTFKAQLCLPKPPWTSKPTA